MNFAELLRTFESVSSLAELKTVLEVIAGPGTYRIEIWVNHSNANAPYHGRVYSQGKNGDELEDFPWVDERTEDAAIHSALEFVEERVAGRS